MSHTIHRSLGLAIAATLLSATALPLGTHPVFAQEKTVTVGGAPMYPSKNIVENALNSKDHTTLVAAVKAAGLVDTLSGSGPFTVFAPTSACLLTSLSNPAHVPLPADRTSLYRVILARARENSGQPLRLEKLKQLAWRMVTDRRRDIRSDDQQLLPPRQRGCAVENRSAHYPLGRQRFRVSA
jgi:hypothetical protein